MHSVNRAPGGQCTNERVRRQAAERLRVRDAMVASPKALAAGASVGDVRGVFGNPHVVSMLLVDGRAFAGVVHRDDVAVDERDDRPARELARHDAPTIGPDAPLSEALSELDERGARRLVVLDADGTTLLGLLCLTSDGEAFCQAGRTVS